MDRGVTLASLLTLASVSLVVLMSVSKISFDVGVLLMLFLAVPVCVVCAAAFFFRSRGGVFASERGRCGAIAWLNRFAGYLGLVMKRGGDLGAAFGAAALNQLCILSVLACIAWGIGGANLALTTFLCSPFVLLLNTIPLSPGNVGWTEVMAASVWALFGESDGVVVFVVFRVLLTVFSLGGSVIWLRRKKMCLWSARRESN